MQPLIVCRITPEAQGVVSLLLRDKDGANLPAYEPGAHIDVDLGNGMTRQYSLCGDPAQCDEYRLGSGWPLTPGADRAASMTRYARATPCTWVRRANYSVYMRRRRRTCLSPAGSASPLSLA